MKLLKVTLVLAAAALLFAQADSALEKAIRKETLEGDLKGAIDQYRKLAQGKDRAVAAKALVRMGQCYDKLGDAESRKAYERVVHEFGDQTEAAAEARKLLAAMEGPARGGGVTLRKLDLAGFGSNSISADGRYIAANHGVTLQPAVIDTVTGKHWYVRNPDGGEVWDRDVIISKDGQWLAYWHGTGRSPGEARVVSADGKRGHTLYRAAQIKEEAYLTDWSPDGKHVSMVLTKPNPSGAGSITEIVLLPVDGGSPGILGPFKYSVSSANVLFSPDGRYVAYDCRKGPDLINTDVFVRSATGGPEVPIASHDALDRVAGWLADGSLLFLSERTGSWSLHRVPLKDGQQAGEPELVRREIGPVAPIGVTGSGAFHFARRLPTRNALVAAMDFATGRLISQPQRATERYQDATSNASWSADGRVFAYVQEGADFRSQVVIRREGEPGEQALPPLFVGHQLGQVRLLSDGAAVLAHGVKDDKRGVLRIDARTGETSLLEGTGIEDWSQDGTVAFLATGDSIVRRDLRSGAEKTIHTVDRLLQVGAISLDGRLLAYWHDGKDAAKEGCRDALSVIPVDGGPPRTIHCKRRGDRWFFREGRGNSAWTSDGRYLLFVIYRMLKGQEGPEGWVSELWSSPADGSAARKTELSGGGFIERLSIHPDGKRLAYSLFDRKIEHWVMENFLPAEKGARR